MNFHTASTNYLNHLRIERALATNTIESYQRDLGKFALFLIAGNEDFSHLSPTRGSAGSAEIALEGITIKLEISVKTMTRNFDFVLMCCKV